MCKLANNKRLSVFLTLVMITTLFAGMTISASATGTKVLYASDFTDDEYIITASATYDTYELGETLSGKTIIVNKSVTIIGNNMTRSGGTTVPGTPHTDLTIECQTSGVTLTLKDYYALNNANSGSSPTPGGTVAPGYSLIRFTGSGNELAISGDVLLESTTYVSAAGIAVNAGTTLNITGETSGENASRFFLYKYTQGCGIGSDANTANGDITFESGNVFIKGSKTGAVVGNDAGTGTDVQSSLGDICITGGNINIVNKAQGAGIGGSRMSLAGNCYISGGNVNLVTDYSAPVIGAGAQRVNYSTTANGNLIVTGGSVKTMIMGNGSYAFNGVQDYWNYSGFTKYFVPNTAYGQLGNDWYIISDEAIMADKTDGTSDVYLYKFDTSSLNATTYDVDVDGKDFYDGGTHIYEYSDIQRKTGTFTTPDNWVACAGGNVDSNLYLYLTGEDHLLRVNGNYYKLTWNSGTGSFSTSSALATYTLGGTGTYSTLSAAKTALGSSAGVIEVVGTTAIGTSESIALSGNQYIVRGAALTGDIFTVGSGSALTLSSGAVYGHDSSATTGSIVNVNGGTFTMSGGTLANNHATNGGAVYLGSGTFTMTGGTISGNTATGNGAGVYVNHGTTFNYAGSGIATGQVIYLNNTTTTDCYIVLTGALTSNHTFKCASPNTNTRVASGTSTVAGNSLQYVKYVDNQHTFSMTSSGSTRYIRIAT